jgi:hypothetical protein
VIMNFGPKPWFQQSFCRGELRSIGVNLSQKPY